MSEKCRTQHGMLTRARGDQRRRFVLCFIVTSLILLAHLSSVYADTNQQDLFPQSLGPRAVFEKGSVETLIDRLSKQLMSQPYKPELYYYLAQAYKSQGWSDKAAQYMNQWIRISNSDMVVKAPYTFILDRKNDKVLAVDAATGKVVRKMDVGWFPKRLIPTADSSRIYVTNALADSVSAIDAEKMAVTKTIKAGRMPWSGKCSLQGDRVYITNLKSDDVSVIDANTDTVIETVKVGEGPWGVAISPDGRRLYVSNQDSQDIRIIDTGSYSIVDVIGFGSNPQDIAIAPDDEKKLYAIDKDIINDEIEIYIVDLDQAQVISSLYVPATDDPLLARLEETKLDDRLELICGSASANQEVQKPVALCFANPDFPTQNKDAGKREAVTTNTPEKTTLPVGGPEILMEVEPVIEAAYTRVPAASNEKPLSMPEPAAETQQESASPRVERRVLRIVVVVRHDTLWQLSMDNYGMAGNYIYSQIQALNPAIVDINKIYVGQTIRLPVIESVLTGTSYDGNIVLVKPDDNLFRIALNNYGTVDERIYAAILKANPHIEDISIIWVGQRIKLPAL